MVTKWTKSIRKSDVSNVTTHTSLSMLSVANLLATVQKVLNPIGTELVMLLFIRFGSGSF